MSGVQRRPLKEGSKGYCLHCGFRIEVVNVSTGRMMSGPFWVLTWVHKNVDSTYYKRQCRGPVATPKPHTKKKADGQ